MESYNKLDVAAKIFPSVTSKKNSSVYRVAVILKEQIDPITLQLAVNIIYERYRLFFLRLRRGVFWNYFDENHLHFTVEKETLAPCSTIVSYQNKGYIIKVLYHGNRISVEAYHSITDGSGIMEFLKSLTYYYLMTKHGDIPHEGKILLFNEFDDENVEDSFNKNFAKNSKVDSKRKTRQENAFKLKGKRYKKGGHSTVSGIVSVNGLKKAISKYNCTITAFLIAVLIMSIYEESQKKSGDTKPIVIAVPVNLRKIFKSKTLKNFFGLVNVGYSMNKDTTIEDVIESVNESLSLSADREYLEKLSTKNVKISNNIFSRHTPLVFKNLFLPLSVRFVGENKKTISLSNLGRIDFPSGLVPYIEHVEVLMYPTSKSPMNCALSSFEDKMSINFTRSMTDSSVIRRFFISLTSYASTSVSVYSNSWGEDNE